MKHLFLPLLALLFPTFLHAQNVGIGTATPAAKLEVQGGSIMIDDGANPYTFPAADGPPDHVMSTDGAGNVTWQDPNTLVNDNDWTRSGTNLFPSNIGDNVGIGTNTPTRAFHVNGEAFVNASLEMKGQRLGTALNEGIMYRANDFRSIQITSKGWGNSHALLFNAHANASQVNGDFTTTGNALYNGAVGSFNSGAGLIQYRANGGQFDFLISPNSTGQNDPVNWNHIMSLQRNGRVGIGTTGPTERLDINGQIRIRGGGPANGNVLTSDANGVATWQDPNTLITDNVDDADNVVGNEYQDLGSSRSGNDVTVSIGNGSNTTFSVDDNGDIEQINEGNDINVSGGNSGTATVEVEDDVDLDFTRYFNQEQSSAPNTGGYVYFDENYFNDYPLVGDGGGLAVRNQDGWGALFSTANMQYIQADFHSLRVRSGGPNTGDVLTSTNGNGDATWTDPANLNDNDWTRSGTNLFPSNIGDNVGIGTNAPQTPFAFNAGAGGNDVGFTQDQFAGSHAFEFTTADGAGNQATRMVLRGNGDDRDIEFLTGARGAEQVYVMMEGATQRVGIGTAAPQVLLDTRGIASVGDAFAPAGDAATNTLNLQIGTDANGATNGIGFFENTGFGMKLGYDGTGTGTANALRIYAANDNSLVTFQNGGNVGIGFDNPTFKLHVNGRLKTNGIRETSDRRLKRDVRELSSALATVSQLRGVDFAWRQQDYPEQNLPGGRQLGFIAQEVETVLPQIVDTGGDGYKSVAYTQLVPLLTEAIQEQQALINELRQRNAQQAQALESLRSQDSRAETSRQALEERVAQLEAQLQLLSAEAKR